MNPTLKKLKLEGLPGVENPDKIIERSVPIFIRTYSHYSCSMSATISPFMRDP